MSGYLGWLIAAVCLVICLLLWFRDVRRIMSERESTVKSAEAQLAVCREKARESQNDPAVTEVLSRSESIYRQAVDLYNKALKKPWNYLPSRVMGFHPY